MIIRNIMRFEDLVKTSLIKYPDLYITESLEETTRKVSDYVFMCLGNGLEWAKSKKGYEGYLTDNTSYKTTKNQPKTISPPYGMTKCDKDISRYFKEDYVMVNSLRPHKNPTTRNVWEGFVSDLPKRYKNLTTKDDLYITTAYKNPLLYPYPYFEKRHSVLWEKGSESIREDWRAAAVKHLRWCKEYFLQEEYLTPKIFKFETGEHPIKSWYARRINFLGEDKWKKELQGYIKFLDDTIEKLGG